MSVFVYRKNALVESELFINTIDSYPQNFSKKGIVICAGGVRLFTCAWITINMLRYLGCNLPIEIWYLGSKEMDEQMKNLVYPLNVICIDAYEMRRKHPARRLGGWELKAYSLLYSGFKEILLLDAENVPTKNPEYLFGTQAYNDIGAIFWPDLGRLGRTRPIWKLCGVEFRNEPEFESGQIVVNKEKCWNALNLSMYYNDNSDFYYNYIHGDKETFHMAFRKLKQSYIMISKPVILKSGVMYQHDLDGSIIFQHRNGPKWNYHETNPRISEFEHEDKCFEFLNQLKTQWDGVIKNDLNHFSEKAKLAIDALTSKMMIYKRVGYDSRPMSFLRDGRIDIGSAALERFWNIREDGGDLFLEIFGNKTKICDLKLIGEVWKGYWNDFERMPIEIARIYDI